MSKRANAQPDDRLSGNEQNSAGGVQQMLARLRECGDRYESDVFHPQPPASDAQRDTPVQPHLATPISDSELVSLGDFESDVPLSIGRFQIVRRLGQGGHGLVFLAYDIRLKRPVALKIPRPEALLTPELRARFLREAEAAAALNHPNLVPVFETGSDGPLCYIAAAYVEGVSLAEWLAASSNKATPREAASLIATLADAIQHAHSRGILHRDMKPANIMLSGAADSSAPTRSALTDCVPQITDFGLAKVEDDEACWTRSGSILGTPAYMSPEQSVSGSTEIGPASDVYSLGAILYELLSGRPPFQADSLLETLQAVQQQEPRALSGEAPIDLESICLKCLEKQPERRYASATALAADLQRFLSGHPVQARPVTGMQRFGRWIARNPVITGVSAAAVLLLAALSIVSTVGYLKTVGALEDRNAALEAVELHRGEALLRFELAQDVVAEFLVQTAGDPRLQSQPLEPLRRSLLERARDYYDQLLREAPHDAALRKHSGLASWRLGNIHRLLGDFEKSADAFETSITILSELAAESPDDLELQDHLGRAYSDFGTMYHVQYNSTQSAGHWESAREIYERIETRARRLADPKLRERILQNVAAAYTHAGGNRLASKDFGSAESYQQRALVIRRELVEDYPATPDHRFLLANSHINLATLHSEIGQFDSATTDFEQAVETMTRLVEKYPDQPRYAHYLAKDQHLLYLHDSHHGSRETAARVLQAAIDGLEDLCRRHADVPEYLLELAKCHYNMAISRRVAGNLQGSAESLARTNVLVDQVRARDYPITWTLLKAMSMTQGLDEFVDGDYEAARRHYHKALEVCRQQAEEHPDDLYAQLSLGDVYLDLALTAGKQEQHDEALDDLQQGITIVSGLLAKSDQWHQARQQLGELYLARIALLQKLARQDEAAEDQLRAAELGFKQRPKETLIDLTRHIDLFPDDAYAYWKRGRLHFKSRDFEQTVADCSRAIEIQTDSFHPYYWRARASMLLLDLAPAVADWERVIELNPQENGAHLYLAWIYAVGPPSLRNAPRALELAQAEVLAGRNQTQEILALAHIRNGHFQEALLMLEQPEGMIAGDFLRALAHVHLENHAAARRDFEQGNVTLRDNKIADRFWNYGRETIRDEVAELLNLPANPSATVASES